MDDKAHANLFSLTEATSVMEVWSQFSLSSKKLSLDRSCVEMRESKTASINGRKRLNDVTKLFRSKPKEEQINMMTELLKCYQEEIDQLSRRSKHSETTFFSLYKSLYELPDPCLCMEGLMGIVMSGSTSQLEIERLKAELGQYEQEFQQLKNQDITIRRLEDRLAELQQHNEDSILDEVSKRMALVEAQADERISDILESKRSMERRYNASVDALKEAKLAADRAQNQIYEISTEAEHRISALQSENSILAEGSQRLSFKLAEVESELGACRQAAVSNRSGRGEYDKDASRNGGSHAEDISTLQLLVSRLRDELEEARDGQRGERQQLEASVRDISAALHRERELVGHLKADLSERPSKDEFHAVRRQLHLVQKIAFHVEDDEVEQVHSAGDPEHTIASLEVLLANRLKGMESELSRLRLELAESLQQESSSKDTVSTLKLSLETSTQIIARLEADLESRSAALEQSIVLATGVSSSLVHPKGHHPGSSATVELSQLLGVDGADSSGEQQVRGSTGKVNSNINVQMINILQSQRDAYRDKLSKLEALHQKLQIELEGAQSNRQRLEADNLALYSKIRYLQSYAGGPMMSPKAMKISLRPKAGHRRVTEETRCNDCDDEEEMLGLRVEDHYHALYEERMNPFDQFSLREKQRKLNELPVADRIILNTAMALISSQVGRNVMLVYLGAMHLMVFGILYYSAHYAHAGCDPPRLAAP